MQYYKGKGHHSAHRRTTPRRTLVVAALIALNVIGIIWILTNHSTKLKSYMGAKPKAYITLANNDKYCKGILALAESLREVKSQYPLVAMVTPEVSSQMKEQLVMVGCTVKEVKELDLPEELVLETKRWGPAFTKLLAWKYDEYSKLIFMDSDLFVLKNIDDLMDYGDTLYATVDADASSCVYKPERLNLINSGVLVLKPHPVKFEIFMKTLFNKELLAKGPMNDQDVITHVLAWKKLPYPTYGGQVTHCECADDNRMWNDDVKLVHFTAGLKKLPKPWDYNAKQPPSDISPCLHDYYTTWNKLYEKALSRTLS